MPSQTTFRLFPPFRLDSVNQQLWRGEEEIVLRRKTFDVLCYLADHPSQLVTKAMLLDAVWPGIVVSDSMPATCVAELRRALGDDARTPHIIETVHRRGYRFISQISTTTTARGAQRQPSLARESPKSIMVGREDELAKLQRSYSRVLEGQRRVIFHCRRGRDWQDHLRSGLPGFDRARQHGVPWARPMRGAVRFW